MEFQTSKSQLFLVIRFRNDQHPIQTEAIPYKASVKLLYPDAKETPDTKWPEFRMTEPVSDSLEGCAKALALFERACQRDEMKKLLAQQKNPCVSIGMLIDSPDQIYGFSARYRHLLLIPEIIRQLFKDVMDDLHYAPDTCGR